MFIEFLLFLIPPKYDFCKLSYIDCKPQIIEERLVEVSFYNAEVGQTDSTPFITADGTDLRDGEAIVANNCLPFGTIVQLDSKGYRVGDRMNRRYGCNNFDFFIKDKEEALRRGRYKTKILIFK